MKKTFAVASLILATALPLAACGANTAKESIKADATPTATPEATATPPAASSSTATLQNYTDSEGADTKKVVGKDYSFIVPAGWTQDKLEPRDDSAWSADDGSTLKVTIGPIDHTRPPTAKTFRKESLKELKTLGAKNVKIDDSLKIDGKKALRIGMTYSAGKGQDNVTFTSAQYLITRGEQVFVISFTAPTSKEIKQVSTYVFNDWKWS